MNKDVQMNLTALVWTIVERNAPASYYLTIFDLNNWYVEWMPSTCTKPETSIDNKQVAIKNSYITNFTLPIKNDLSSVKLLVVVDHKIKSILNRNKLSSGNCLNELLCSKEGSESEDNESCEMASGSVQDTTLSMNFGMCLLR